MIDASFQLLDESQPLLALAIHAGHQICPELIEHTGISEEDRLREEDPFTDQIAAMYPNAITLNSSRFTIDLNRPREKALYLKPKDCWGLPIKRKKLPADTIKQLYRDYDQWYAHLDYCVNRLLQHSPFLIVLDLHSYNYRRFGPLALPEPQIQNPDIILGRNILPQNLYPKVETLRQLLDGQDLMGYKIDCRCDVKFPGGHLSRYLNHNYQGKILCLAIEFKKIFMDEWSGKLNQPVFEALKRMFFDAVDRWQRIA